MDFLAQLDRDGYALVPAAIAPATLDPLQAALDEMARAAAGGPERGPYGVRNLLRRALAVRELGRSLADGPRVAPVLGAGAFAVRGLFFDKPANANWKVPWHQDLSIAVRERSDVPGFGPWSVKAGVPHVQPPVEILQRMLAVRIHLDDCGEENGPLNVLAGSHAQGRLSPEAIREWRARAAPVTCLLPRGGALLMRPLLLHASSASRQPGHRRVIHLEFATEPLPGGLAWEEA
jgi:hypothetical protein